MPLRESCVPCDTRSSFAVIGWTVWKLAGDASLTGRTMWTSRGELPDLRSRKCHTLKGVRDFYYELTDFHEYGVQPYDCPYWSISFFIYHFGACMRIIFACIVVLFPRIQANSMQTDRRGQKFWTPLASGRLNCMHNAGRYKWKSHIFIVQLKFTSIKIRGQHRREKFIHSTTRKLWVDSSGFIQFPLQVLRFLCRQPEMRRCGSTPKISNAWSRKVVFEGANSDAHSERLPELCMVQLILCSCCLCCPLKRKVSVPATLKHLDAL